MLYLYVLSKIQKKTKTSQAQQEEIVTSSDSECRREIGSLKSRYSITFL